MLSTANPYRSGRPPRRAQTSHKSDTPEIELLQEVMGLANAGFEQAARLLPPRWREAAAELKAAEKDSAEEFRLRAGGAATVLTPCGERELLPGRELTRADIRSVLEVATGASAHSAADSLKRGFVTVKGGCRVGFCGEIVTIGGEAAGMKSLSSAAIRIPRSCPGCADEIWPKLRAGGFSGTLIISPPGAGKTTLLRELIRLLSEDGLRVSLADERFEVAACWEGLPQFDLGPRTDVLSGGRKAESAMTLLRAMNPQVIAMDEISTPGDAAACESAANCGVLLLATAHAGGVEDLALRPVYKKLLDRHIFRRTVTIKRQGANRRLYVEEMI